MIKELLDSNEYNKHTISDKLEDDYLLVILNGILVNPFEQAKKENILIFRDRILGTDSNPAESMPENIKNIIILDAEGLFITPGLIDQHIHGGYGVDFNLSSSDEMIELSRNLPEHGITTILPTLMTASEEVIRKQTEKIKEAKYNKPVNTTKFLGIHLEGPLLSRKYKGIHPESQINEPTIENFKKVEDSEIKIVTFAPEQDEAFEFTKYLLENNIIASGGHSNATSEEIYSAQQAGLKQVTHLFNAMSPLHHREPGVVGQALTNDTLYVELIADGMHINPTVIDLALRAKPKNRVILISDSLPLNCYKGESLIFGEQKIYNKNGSAVNEAGTFAGSLIFVDTAINNLVNWNLADFSTAIGFATKNVTQNLNINDVGYIDKGKIADIVLWKKDDFYSVQTTIINGQIAFTH